MKVLACYNKNYDIRINSSSGGIFSLIATRVLAGDGVVYGVSMTTDCYGAEYIRVVDEQGLALIRGSKYMQAKMGNVLKKVRMDLQDGKLVLFSGTACQINGLKKFLMRDYNNLVTVDVICHGTPSPLLWKKYAEYQEANFGSKLEKVSFRCKDYSWTDFGMKENKVYISKDEDPFMQMFLKDYCLRPSCYQCKAKEEKMSDITMADFWGIELCAPEMNDGKGTSLIIVRTQRGEEIIETIKSLLCIKEVSYKDGVRCNPAEFRSAFKPSERDTFFDDMRALDFYALTVKYASPRKVSPINRVKRKIKSVIISVFGGDKRFFGMNYGLLFEFQDRIK